MIQRNCIGGRPSGEANEAHTTVQEHGSSRRSIDGIGAVAARAATKTVLPPASDVGVAADFPEHRIVLGRSVEQLMAFNHGSFSGEPKELLTSAPMADI